MRLCLLLIFLVRNSWAAASCSCHHDRDATYTSPSKQTIENVIYFPIYTTSDSFLVINEQKYFWTEKAYISNESRPVVCREEFTDKLTFLSRIFLFDEDEKPSNVSLLERLNNPVRPKNIIFDCRADQYCCDGECCKYKWIVQYGIFLFLGAVICVSCISCVKPEKLSACLLSISTWREQRRDRRNRRARTEVTMVPLYIPEEPRRTESVESPGVPPDYNQFVPPSYDEVRLTASGFSNETAKLLLSLPGQLGKEENEQLDKLIALRAQYDKITKERAETSQGST